jgi:hypothetical protein
VDEWDVQEDGFRAVRSRTHLSQSSKWWTTDEARNFVAQRVLTEDATENPLPSLARELAHLTVECGPASLHFLIADDALGRFTIEI